MSPEGTLPRAGGEGATPVPAPTRAIGIAILALGGEGGGVLADWLVDLAEPNGYYAQTTSVPGVAQRTGATLYYIELFPEAAARAAGAEPVLALMPAPGQVDVVIASELMEAGRAIERGIVTPDRTTLLVSTHRVYAMTEKIALGDGRADAERLIAACRKAARRVVLADMQRLAEEQGSVVSAVLFGALAGAGVLPFGRAQFEEAIRRRGIGVTPSLAAFAAGYRAAGVGALAPVAALEPALVPTPMPAPRQTPRQSLAAQAARDFPAAALPIIAEGVRRLIDYQDRRYAEEYLARLLPIRDLDRAQGDGGGRLLQETARYLALWMSYEDTVRVADLKIRASRFARVRAEVRLAPDQLLQIKEFLHPRIEEIADTLPAGLGRRLMRGGLLRRLLLPFTRRGRVIETTALRGFLLMWGVASLRRWRRHTLRYAVETARIEEWLARVAAAAPRQYDLAAELAECPRLVKGYGDTHARGWANYQRLMAAAQKLEGRPDAAAILAGLREAALADEMGDKLTTALAATGAA